MDDRMSYAPCGYLSLTDDYMIREVNETLLTILGYDPKVLIGCHFESILSQSSRIFFQIYFTPLIKLNNKIEEMYLTLKSAIGLEVPVLLNAVRRESDGLIVHECVFIGMRQRIEYEKQISASETAAKKAKSELKRVQAALAVKRQEWDQMTDKLKTYQEKIREAEDKADKAKTELQAVQRALDRKRTELKEAAHPPGNPA